MPVGRASFQHLGQRQEAFKDSPEENSYSISVLEITRKQQKGSLECDDISSAVLFIAAVILKHPPLLDKNNCAAIWDLISAFLRFFFFFQTRHQGLK